MDFHILIVISCVFLFSLLSLLLINRFFRRKTFEEVVAEKRAFTEKIYGSQRAAKKPKKLPLKKVMKLEKKQRRKLQNKTTNAKPTHTAEESDAQSEEDNILPGLSKTHVEFEPEPEVVTFTADTLPKVPTPKAASKKQQKKNEKKTAGILINKNEPVAVKTNTAVPETNFELKHAKDVVELKKMEVNKQTSAKKGKENKKEKVTSTTTTGTGTGTGTTSTATPANISSNTNVTATEPKVEVCELKAQEEKVRHSSPKIQQNNKNKQQIKKQNKETAATKELVQALDKLSDNDTVSVSLLMNLFRRAELNRSEIQILIDYLLNRQQDMPTTHSEWSDDQCQKLKRQLEEKERALAEEQEASIGLQTKLRELRAEINTERMQINATIKAYTEKLQAKDQEIVGLTQELQLLNEKFAAERQQFQAKLLREKQAGQQDLMAQLKLMSNEISHKDKCINELTCLVNASHQSVEEAQQKNDIIQKQAQQIRALEQQRDELEQMSNNQIFELEKLKTLETENAELKVEIRNLQNALESAKGDVGQVCKETDNLKAEITHLRNYELNEKQQDIKNLQAKNAELSQQLAGKNLEQTKEHSEMQALLHNLREQLDEKERLLAEFNVKNAELLQRLQHMANSAQQQKAQQQDLHQRVDILLLDVSKKDQLLEEMEQRAQQLNSREKELLQQLHEYKEKNNEGRLKNWKLIEALQNAEQKIISQQKLTTSNTYVVQQQQQQQQQTQMLSAIQSPASTVDSAAKEQAKIRALYERLYPEAVKACASIALSASFDKWVEQVLSTHLKQEFSKSVVPSPVTATATTNTVALSSSHKSTQSNNNTTATTTNNNGTSNGATPHNLHTSSSSIHSNNNNESSSSNSSDENKSSQINNNNNNNNISLTAVEHKNDAEVQTLQQQNAQLRAKIDELTKLVTKTSNTLSDLESHAREQEDHWRSVVRSQEEKIQLLQHSNGQQDV